MVFFRGFRLFPGIFSPEQKQYRPSALLKGLCHAQTGQKVSAGSSAAYDKTIHVKSSLNFSFIEIRVLFIQPRTFSG